MRAALLFLAVLAAGCSGGSSTENDAGLAAPACDPLAQSGCGSGQKCTIRLDTGALTCGAAGSGAAYASCASDADCSAGTACLSATPQSGFDGSQSCRPFCDPATQAHLACNGGGRCDFVDRTDSNVGFCERQVSDSNAPDAG